MKKKIEDTFKIVAGVVDGYIDLWFIGKPDRGDIGVYARKLIEKDRDFAQTLSREIARELTKEYLAIRASYLQAIDLE